MMVSLFLDLGEISDPNQFTVATPVGFQDGGEGGTGGNDLSIFDSVDVVGGISGVATGGGWMGFKTPTRGSIPGKLPIVAAGSDRSFAAGRGVLSLRCAVGVGVSTFVNANFARCLATDNEVVLGSASPPADSFHARRLTTCSSR